MREGPGSRLKVALDDECSGKAVVVNSNMSRGKYLARELRGKGLVRG